MSTPLLQVKNLTKIYFLHEQQRKVTTFAPLTFEVTRGESVSLSGPSGVGKSSVLNCVYRTCLSNEGEILFHQSDQQILDLCQLSDREILSLRESGDIGFVTQFLKFLPRKSALEIVAQPLLKQGVSKEEAFDTATNQLKHFMLREKLWHLSPSTFSGGERQRVNLARGTILQPKLLLLDEPTASLDHATATRAMDFIHQTARQSNTSILSIFHDRSMIETYSDKEITIR